jgi:HAD superfamily hydrolase (TIGR01509 family)
MTPFDLIIFDCDGVLIDSEMLWNEVFVAALADAGVSLPHEEVLREYIGLNKISTTAKIQARHGIKISDRFWDDARASTFKLYEKRLKPISGVAELVDALQCKKCVASSSGPKTLRYALGLVGLWDRFAPHIFSTEQVENGKPAPDLFLFAAKHMGVDPSACLVIRRQRCGRPRRQGREDARLRLYGGQPLRNGARRNLAPRGSRTSLCQNERNSGCFIMISAAYNQWKFDTPVLSLAVNRNGDWVAAALADGTARLFPASDEAVQPKSVKLHDGISLSLQPDADEHAFLSGGDDGKVLILDPAIGETTLLAEHKNTWIDFVAGSSDGKFRTYNTGKTIHVLNEEGQKHALLSVPSNPGGISFSPNGKRLAVSHYNGVTLWWLNTKEQTSTTLEWKGSHLGLIWSPDGKVLLSSMQEAALHGWQLVDNKEMRMQGYAAKIKSMGFTARGKYLATSGAEQVICWPFSAGGPWGKAPLTLGGADNRLVTHIAPHPKDEMVAAGYTDGMIILAPLDGRMEIMINPPQDAAINGLVWNADGDALFASSESGSILLFTIDSVKKALVHAG